MQSDRQLIASAGQGCQESMRAIYMAHKDALLSLACALVHDRESAEDVVHDVFVAFARSLAELRLRGSLRAYLCTSVCNRVRDGLRARTRRDNRCQGPGPDPRTEPSPEAQVARQELLGRLAESLEQVPADQREVLILRTQADLTFKEIARLQGVSINTVQGRYRYGLEKLRSLMNSEPLP